MIARLLSVGVALGPGSLGLGHQRQVMWQLVMSKFLRIRLIGWCQLHIRIRQDVLVHTHTLQFHSAWCIIVYFVCRWNKKEWQWQSTSACHHVVLAYVLPYVLPYVHHRCKESPGFTLYFWAADISWLYLEQIIYWWKNDWFSLTKRLRINLVGIAILNGKNHWSFSIIKNYDPPCIVVNYQHQSTMVLETSFIPFTMVIHFTCQLGSPVLVLPFLRLTVKMLSFPKWKHSLLLLVFDIQLVNYCVGHSAAINHLPVQPCYLLSTLICHQ